MIEGTADSSPNHIDGNYTIKAAPSSTQAQHVAHVIEARIPPEEETSGAQGANREGGATFRLVCNLDALPGSGEKDGMIPHDVPSPDGRETDR